MGYKEEPFQKSHGEMYRKNKGMFAFISNRDEEAKKIYLAYKERWDIEQCFDYLKNSVDIGAASQRSNESLLG